MQESMCASVWTYAVEVKGSGDEWLPEQLVEDFETIGLTQERLILKADQEPSITDMQRVVVRRRAGHGTALEQSHVGVSNQMGELSARSKITKDCSAHTDQHWRRKSGAKSIWTAR